MQISGISMKVYLCSMKKVVLKRKISNRVINGHPWIFSNEIDMAEESLAAGDIASYSPMTINSLEKGM
jgi:23S rRNA (cytosine1962-C5)-methyltransferase